MKKTVFLDRDGVVNKKAMPHEYITKEEDLVLLPGAAEAIALLNRHDYRVIIVTNQRGVARGFMTLKDVDKIHNRLRDELKKTNAYIDAIYVCPHDEGECNCRKPEIGLFLKAEQDFEIDKNHAWMIGDSQTDIQAGENYGIKTILTTDLLSAVKEIIG